MRVSIVTISYNQAVFLERAIRSVVTQNYPDIEYIVVDAGSRDGSREVIQRYKSAITRIILEADEGPADGLNKGFAAATGDICGYVNADDAYLPGAIAEAVGAFEAEPGIDVVCGHTYIVGPSGRMIRRSRSDPFSLWGYAHGGVVIMQPSSFFKRQGYEEVGGFNRRNPVCWDGELFVDLALAGKKFMLADRYWSLFTSHPESISTSGRLRQEFVRHHERIAEKIVGRPAGRMEAMLRITAKMNKWRRGPKTLALRIAEKIVGPPAFTFPLDGSGAPAGCVEARQSPEALAQSPDSRLSYLVDQDLLRNKCSIRK